MIVHKHDRTHHTHAHTDTESQWIVNFATDKIEYTR